jgi:hypothetical protein
MHLQIGKIKVILNLKMSLIQKKIITLNEILNSCNLIVLDN